ncbi:MAG: phosphopantetheine-binding protein [Acidobacteria bacterium]|nr:phosphopantetheine-binding protein [Acidobacteriota bacterium]
MQTTEERVFSMLLGAGKRDAMTPKARELFNEAQDFTLSDFGISSVEAQGLLKQIEESFGVEIPAETAAKFTSLKDLTNYLDARS